MIRIANLLVFLCFAVLCFRPALITVRGAGEPDAQVKSEDVEEGVSVEDEKTKFEGAEGAAGNEAVGEGEAGTSAEGGDEVGKEVEEPESAPDVQTRVLFLEPIQLKPEIELHAGKRARLLVGFASLGPKARNYSVLAIDASFLYPQDYTYFLQNHTARIYRTAVEAGNYATFEYSFNVHESFGARPFGLTITVYYTLLEDETNSFHSAVFNATINIREEERGFGFDTLFMYGIFAGLLSFIGFLVYHYLLQHGGKRRTRTRVAGKPGIERGTQEDQNVDLEWIPPHVQNVKKAANGQPRRRKAGKYSETSGGEETTEEAAMTESDVPTSTYASVAAGRRGAKAGGGKGNKGGGNSGGESD